MYSKLVRALTIGVFAVGAVAMAHAQQVVPAGPGVDVGKWEYDANCAACHGASGKGDGFYAAQLKTAVPNLTELSKKNNGAFPFKHVYETIDGREAVRAHGMRDMPIWGKHYLDMSPNLSPYYDPEGFARAKILALTEYVYRLQEK